MHSCVFVTGATPGAAPSDGAPGAFDSHVLSFFSFLNTASRVEYSLSHFRSRSHRSLLLHTISTHISVVVVVAVVVEHNF